ncbi:hypothetical protein M501DRAFT_989785 [Patellaria atrata CBS 101060]|uniref:Uncharacterized protein n=1 Tax=Patellaria atrata CBS 101060 TaxID=1346257 RepID=A0A9P4SEV7_9PEZI|nr:hypothetical protein M501DRAFT_989785 [Patellaria atrata CBS 101060]
MEVIREEPDLSSFTPLAEHQSQTPGTFFGGKPVLYHRTTNTKLVIGKQDLEAHPSLARLTDTGASKNGTNSTDLQNGAVVNGDAHNISEQIVIDGIDVWVGSENIIIYSNTTKTGIHIPYPTISLHAIQRLCLPSSPTDAPEIQGLYIQLTLHDTETINSDDDIDTVELAVVPSSTPTTASATEIAAAPQGVLNTDTTEDNSTQALFNAVSACADLHPDPVSDDEEGVGSTAPGAGGWITSENMNQFYDENGQFVGGAALGAGAGNVRSIDAVDGAQDEVDWDSDETKWRRTE